MSTLSQKESIEKKRLRKGGRDVRLSKKLSWILRHGAVDKGLNMDEAGYVPVHQLLSTEGFKDFTVDEVRRIVRENDKQRYSLLENSNGTLFIRANQGHSGSVARRIEPDRLLQRISLSDLRPETICVHGTTTTAWESIQKEGLSRMNRQMIHCAVGLPQDDGVISGMRSSSKVLIYVDIHAAVADGIFFFRSDNNVLLTPGMGESGHLPVRYLRKVACRDTGNVLYENAQAGKP